MRVVLKNYHIAMKCSTDLEIKHKDKYRRKQIIFMNTFFLSGIKKDWLKTSLYRAENLT